MMVLFVFGSNLAGRHGAGDALTARLKHGAIYGQGEGLQGQSYGLPTKNEHIRSLPLAAIQKNVARFLTFAHAHPGLIFDIAAVGCRMAGYTPAQVAPFFRDAPPNCFLHPEFAAVLHAQGLHAQAGPPPAPVPAQGQLGF